MVSTVHASSNLLENNRPLVMKFGGTSVEDSSAFNRVANIIKKAADKKPVVVVSAMSRITDLLISSVDKSSEAVIKAGDLLSDQINENSFEEILEGFKRYRNVARELLSPPACSVYEVTVDGAEAKIAELLRITAMHPVTKTALCDEVISFGERLSAELLTEILKSHNLDAISIDARKCIITDDEHGKAAPVFEITNACLREKVQPLITAGKIPVMGGFIASATSGATTTLGRGGSDYSAAIVGAGLMAREIQIWTDVTGVLSADPRIVKDAKPVPRLSYSEAAELAYFGAKVLHPKTIQPAVEHNIPVRICNSREPASSGTIVSSETERIAGTVKAIAHKAGITIVQISSARMLGAFGFLRALFEVFEKHRIAIDVVTTSEVSVSLTIDDNSKLPQVIDELRQLGFVRIVDDVAIICIVGEGLRDTPGIAARAFRTLNDLNVMLISHGASSVNLTFAVAASHANEAVVRLHSAFF